MHIQYLEIATANVDAVCATYSRLHGIAFGDNDPSLGGARTGALAGGGRIGVRAPMHESEQPVIRPYTLVENIDESVAVAADAGAEVALPPTPLPGHGTCAILVQGGVQIGLWQL